MTLTGEFSARAMMLLSYVDDRLKYIARTCGDAQIEMS